MCGWWHIRKVSVCVCNAIMERSGSMLSYYILYVFYATKTLFLSSLSVFFSTLTQAYSFISFNLSFDDREKGQFQTDAFECAERFVLTEPIQKLHSYNVDISFAVLCVCVWLFVLSFLNFILFAWKCICFVSFRLIFCYIYE